MPTAQHSHRATLKAAAHATIRRRGKTVRKDRRRAPLKAAARATTKRRKSKNRNPPGYISPIRINTKVVGAHLPIRIADAFRTAAKLEGTTVYGMITGFVLEKIKGVLPTEERDAFIKLENTRARIKYGQSFTATP